MGKKHRILIPAILAVSLLSQALLGCGNLSHLRERRSGQEQTDGDQAPQKADERQTGQDPQGTENHSSGIDTPNILAPAQQPGEQIKSISVGKYAYEQLDEEEKSTYDQMLTTILNQEEKVELATMDTDKMRRAYMALNSDYGGLFWVDGYMFTTYTKGEKLVGLEFAPSYTMGRERRKELQGQIDQVVDEWLSGISISDSDYAKAKYVFETLIEQVDYVEESEDNQNIISVFLNRKTVCQGYASATQYMLQQLGIPCTIISGTANSQSHAWNLVLLDGKYYHLDTTWGNSTYLNTESQEAKFVNYNYFALTTQELLRTHVPSGEFELPECTSVADNYYVQEGRWIEVFEPDLIGAIFSEAREQGEQSCSVKFADVELYNQACEYFISQQKIAEYIPGMEYVYYLKNDGLLVLTINFNEM